MLSLLAIVSQCAHRYLLLGRHHSTTVSRSVFALIEETRERAHRNELGDRRRRHWRGGVDGQTTQSGERIVLFYIRDYAVRLTVFRCAALRNNPKICVVPRDYSTWTEFGALGVHHDGSDAVSLFSVAGVSSWDDWKCKLCLQRHLTTPNNQFYYLQSLTL